MRSLQKKHITQHFFKIALFVYFISSFYILPPVALTDSIDEMYELKIPPGVLEPIVPDENPLTKGKVELEKKLYFGKRLSANDTVLCFLMIE